jgi:hypothetical protein
MDLKKAFDSFRREILYNILIEFDIRMKLASLIKVCLTETYSRVRVGKNLSYSFPIKSALKQCSVAIAFQLCFRVRHWEGSGNPRWLAIEWCTHQLLVYADDVNILGGILHNIKENAEALVVANKEIAPEVNADKTKYMFMSRDQNARGSQNVKISNSSFERMEEYKYLGKALTNQYSIREETNSRLKSGNACYITVQNLLSSSLVSKN